MTFNAQMFTTVVAISSAALGCTPFPNKQFQRVTGIPVDDGGMSLCVGIAGHDGEDCKPSVGGAPWVEALNISPYIDATPTQPMASGQDFQAAASIAKRVFGYYVGHVYASADVQPGCPSTDPFSDSNQSLRSKTNVEYASFSVASIYTKKAVEKARASLETAAKAQGMPIAAETIAKFELELKKTIESSSNSSTDVVFVQAYWVGGIRSMDDHLSYRECFRLAQPDRDSIITGIAGLYYSNFRKRSTYFESSWMSAAIDASIKGSYAGDPLKLQAVSARASVEWQKNIEETLKVDMSGREFSSGFRPLYIRFERPNSIWSAKAAAATAQGSNIAVPSVSSTPVEVPTAPLKTPAPAPMPIGAEWTGVFFSDIFGYLHLSQDGTRINGKWIRPGHDHWGIIDGTADGNIFKFTWKEYDAKGSKSAAPIIGDGYFRYFRPQGDNVDDQLDGVARDTAKGHLEQWDAIKQRHRKPDLKSIPGSPDGLHGDWDSR